MNVVFILLMICLFGFCPPDVLTIIVGLFFSVSGFLTIRGMLLARSGKTVIDVSQQSKKARGMRQLFGENERAYITFSLVLGCFIFVVGLGFILGTLFSLMSDI